VQHDGTIYLTGTCYKYTADFLIHHKTTGKANFIEVKLCNYADDVYFYTCKAQVDACIQQQHLGWEFKMVYDDEIQFRPVQREIYNEVTSLQRGFEILLKMQKRDKRYNESEVRYFKHIPHLCQDEPLSKAEYVQFVKQGIANELCFDE